MTESTNRVRRSGCATRSSEYESSGGQQGTTLRDTGLPVVIVTSRGNKSGKIRKTPLMRVEHDGEYLLVASMGGAPKHPVWYYNLKADPANVDGPGRAGRSSTSPVRELDGDERAQWWERAVAAFPPYADYQQKTARTIPVFLATPQGLNSALLARFGPDYVAGVVRRATTGRGARQTGRGRATSRRILAALWVLTCGYSQRRGPPEAP